MRDESKIGVDFVNSIVKGSALTNLEAEASRGCISTIFQEPVRLEPRFEKFNSGQIYTEKKGKSAIFLKRTPRSYITKILFPVQDELDWPIIESAIIGFSGFNTRFSFEIVGNRAEVAFYLVFQKTYFIETAQSILRKINPDIDLIRARDPVRGINRYPVDGFTVAEFCYEPPYFHKHFDYAGKSLSTLNSLVRLFSLIPEEQKGVYQVLFQKTNYPWERNIKNALEAETLLKGNNEYGKTASRELKDFTGKPLFVVRPRLLVTTSSREITNALHAVVGEFQTEGQRLFYKSKQDLLKIIKPSQLVSMFKNRVSHIPGMIMNSVELSAFMNFPDKSVLMIPVNLKCYDGFKVSERLLEDGIPIGKSNAGVVARIPWASKNFTGYKIGKSTMGKTTSDVSEILFLVRNGFGVAVFDPHNNLIPALTSTKILENHSDKVVYFDPGDKEYTPDYNPFDIKDHSQIGKLTADYVDSTKSLFSDSFGYRMAHILTMSYYALFLLGDNLASLPVLLSKSQQGVALRNKVIAKVDNPEVKRFFEHELSYYPQEATMPVINKITTLLMDNKIHRILSRRKSKIDVPSIVNEGKVFLASLPGGIIGAEISSALGAMLIAQFQKACFARADIPESERRPFFIYVDEAYRFNCANIYESLINEGRKFGGFLNIAHQSLGQLSKDTQKTFLSIQNIMVFGINIDDARIFSRVFDNRVKPEDLASLSVGEVIARINNETVKLRTFPPATIRRSDTAERKIIRKSRRLYYTKTADLDKQPKRKPRVYDSF